MSDCFDSIQTEEADNTYLLSWCQRIILPNNKEGRNVFRLVLREVWLLAIFLGGMTDNVPLYDAGWRGMLLLLQLLFNLRCRILPLMLPSLQRFQRGQEGPLPADLSLPESGRRRSNLEGCSASSSVVATPLIPSFFFRVGRSPGLEKCQEGRPLDPGLHRCHRLCGGLVSLCLLLFREGQQ